MDHFIQQSVREEGKRYYGRKEWREEEINKDGKWSLTWSLSWKCLPVNSLPAPFLLSFWIWMMFIISSFSSFFLPLLLSFSPFFLSKFLLPFFFKQCFQTILWVHLSWCWKEKWEEVLFFLHLKGSYKWMVVQVKEGRVRRWRVKMCKNKNGGERKRKKNEEWNVSSPFLLQKLSHFVYSFHLILFLWKSITKNHDISFPPPPPQTSSSLAFFTKILPFLSWSSSLNKDHS